MIRAVIIEDELPAAQRLEKMLSSIDPEIQVVAKHDSIKSSVKWFGENAQPDLLFLDIQLGDGLSFEIFSRVSVKSFVIFTTAYDEYAIKAFELNSIDYLLKPVDRAKLAKSIQKFRELNRPEASIDMMLELKRLLERRGPVYKKRFAIAAGSRIRSVETGEIAFFRSTEKNTFLCTFDAREYPLEFSLDRLETMIDPETFFRISRQHIIHYKAITKISILSKSRLELTVTGSPEKMQVSSARTHAFREWIDR